MNENLTNVESTKIVLIFWGVREVKGVHVDAIIMIYFNKKKYLKRFILNSERAFSYKAILNKKV